MSLMDKLDKLVEEAISECPEGGDMTVAISRVTAFKQMREVVKDHENAS